MQDQYKTLRAMAELFLDSQGFRKSMANKARSLTVDPAVVAMALQGYQEIEEQLSKDMVKELRRVAPKPILQWIKESPGIGEALVAKLLGIIGDPYIAHPAHWEGTGKGNRHLVEGEPFVRNVDKLWAYCGIGDPARKRRTVKDAEDKQAAAFALVSWKAKTTLYMMTVRILQNRRHYEGSHYLQVYDAARAEYDSRVHAEQCPQCEGSGKGNGEPGKPWKAAHQHAAAQRKLAKEILRDLWEAAREAHQAEHQDQAAAAA